MFHRYFQLIIAAFVLSCSTDQTTLNDGLEFYENGWIKSELVFRTDTSERVAYYNNLDSGSVDSIYHFQVFQDTLLPFYQLIFNDSGVKENLTIKESYENGYQLDVELRNARGDWMYVNFRDEDQNSIKLYRGSWDTNHEEPRTIKIMDSARLSNQIILGDWWIWTQGDTLNSVGRQLERQIFIDLDEWGNEL